MLSPEFTVAMPPAEPPLADLLVRAALSLSRATEAALAPHNVTLAQYQILQALAGMGGITTSMLARHSKLNNGALTRQLDRLEKAGMVERCPDHEDRRRIRLYMTDYASEVLPKLHATAMRIEVALSGIDAGTDVEYVSRFLQEVLKHAASLTKEFEEISSSLATSV